MLGLFMNITREHGGIEQFKLFNKPYLLVMGPDYVKHILQDHYRNFIRGRSMETGRALLGDSLPLTDGDLWLRERLSNCHKPANDFKHNHLHAPSKLRSSQRVPD